MGLQYESNLEDEAIWTVIMPTIRFNIVEMHQSDRVKLQFGMRRDIPTLPMSLGEWHIKRVNHQWNVQY